MDAAEELLHHMIARVTNGGSNAKEYRRARRIVLEHPTGRAHAPKCVRICRDPDAVWSYVKGQYGLDTYDSRRVFLRGEFESLLSALERFDGSPLQGSVEDAAELLDAESVATAWRKASDRTATDPAGAITAARALLEATCKTVLDDRSVKYADSDDLPKLYRYLQKELRLAPSDHTEEQFKKILGGATSVVQGLGSLRNSVGDSHGTGRKTYRPEARHAALAVNLAGSMALFLMASHQADMVATHGPDWRE